MNVLNPCAYIPKTELIPLSDRVSDFEGKVVYLVNSWREGSLMEGFLERVCQAFAKRYQGVDVRLVFKPSPYLSDDPELWDEMVEKGAAFVYAAAPSCSTTAWAVTWASKLEKRGLPGVVIIFDTLIDDAKSTAERLGIRIRWVVVPCPPEMMSGEDRMRSEQAIFDALSLPLVEEEKESGKRESTKPPKIVNRAQSEHIRDYFYDQGWTDGLPIILPTETRVEEMLRGTSHAPDEIISTSMWPEAWEVTVEKVAINGVMAGCRPEYLPVLLAAVEAFSSKDISAMVKSTNSFSFMQVINGPIRHQIRMNGGTSALSPGNRANATIGRALRLFILNLGGGRVGVNMMANLGNVSCYSFCFAENEEGSPWESLAVEKGFISEESVVTIFCGGWFHTGNYISQPITHLAKAMTAVEHPTGIAALMAPPRARLLAQEGYTKAGVKEHLWKSAATTLKQFRANPWYKVFIEPSLEGKVLDGETEIWPPEYLHLQEDDVVPIFPRRAVHIIVVGGEASPMMQGWQMASPLSASIDKWR
jgi:hypothetical protein